MTKSFRKVIGWAAAAVVLGASAAAAQTATPAKPPMPLVVMTSLPTFTQGAFFTMLAKKYDVAHGLALDVRQAGSTSTAQIDAVLSGAADFALPGPINALQAIREGAKLVIVGAHANNQIAAVISNEVLKKVGVSPTAPIAERMRALKGLTIGTNAVGSSYYQLLRYYLQQYGLDPDKDVRLVGTAEATAMIAGIQQGRFGAIVTASGVAEQAISLGAGTLWFSGGRGDIPDSEKSVVVVMVTRPDVIEKKPEAVAAFRAAMTDALKDLNAKHEEVGQLLRKNYFDKLDPAVWELAWGNATKAYPETLAFSKGAYELWTRLDEKGPTSYKDVDYSKIVYGPAQAP